MGFPFKMYLIFLLNARKARVSCLPSFIDYKKILFADIFSAEKGCAYFGCKMLQNLTFAGFFSLWHKICFADSFLFSVTLLALPLPFQQRSMCCYAFISTVFSLLLASLCSFCIFVLFCIFLHFDVILFLFPLF